MEKITFSEIPRKEMVANHLDDYFWYVLDLQPEKPQVIANPFVDDMTERVFIFVEQGDVRKWAHVIHKTPSYQDHKLGIQSDVFRNLLKDEEEEFNRYVLTPLRHDQAERLFQNYPDELRDYKS